MKLVTAYSFQDSNGKTVSFYESKPHLHPESSLSTALGFVTACGEHSNKPQFTMKVELIND
jgi:hypothetical protein